MAKAEQPSGTSLHLEKLCPCRRNVFSPRSPTPSSFGTGGAPAGFTVLGLQFDAVEGRDYRLVMKPPEGDIFHIRGTFLTVEAPRRLAYTFVYEEPGPDDQETLVTLTFEPTELGTRLILDHGQFMTAPRWQLHRDGWTETLERLERFLL
jgi:uncharacterized protein YndB with AHSA1/START domain